MSTVCYPEDESQSSYSLSPDNTYYDWFPILSHIIIRVFFLTPVSPLIPSYILGETLLSHISIFISVFI